MKNAITHKFFKITNLHRVASVSLPLMSYGISLTRVSAHLGDLDKAYVDSHTSLVRHLNELIERMRSFCLFKVELGLIIFLSITFMTIVFDHLVPSRKQ